MPIRIAFAVVGLVSALLPTAATAQVAKCDSLAASNYDMARPSSVRGVPYGRLKGAEAVAACIVALAESSDPRMRFQLARALSKNGEGQAEVARLYREASDGGHLLATYSLANLYLSGIGVQKDAEQARRLSQKASEAGEPLSTYALGQDAYEGNGRAVNYAEALRLFRKSFGSGYPHAAVAVGQMYEKGESVDASARFAVGWYQLAADHDDSDGMVRLGDHYRDGIGVEQDDATAMVWYYSAFQDDNPDGMVAYGLMLERKDGGKNGDLAPYFYRRAAERGNVKGMRILAVNLDAGRGIKMDKKEAADWYRKAEAASGQVPPALPPFPPKNP